MGYCTKSLLSSFASEFIPHHTICLPSSRLGLTQSGVPQPIGYVSKQTDSVGQGWPNCLWAVAPTALLVKEANKLTFGEPLEVATSLIKHKGF